MVLIEIYELKCIFWKCVFKKSDTKWDRLSENLKVSVNNQKTHRWGCARLKPETFVLFVFKSIIGLLTVSALLQNSQQCKDHCGFMKAGSVAGQRPNSNSVAQNPIVLKRLGQHSICKCPIKLAATVAHISFSSFGQVTNSMGSFHPDREGVKNPSHVSFCSLKGSQPKL